MVGGWMRKCLGAAVGGWVRRFATNFNGRDSRYLPVNDPLEILTDLRAAIPTESSIYWQGTPK
jgi:hypothetical protein